MTTKSCELSLSKALHEELSAIPTEHWTENFPVQVALLKFLAATFPRHFSFERAGFNEGGVYLEGRGVDSFTDALWNRDDVFDNANELLIGVVVDLKRRYPDDPEAPLELELNGALVETLEQLVTLIAKDAVADGAVR